VPAAGRLPRLYKKIKQNTKKNIEIIERVSGTKVLKTRFSDVMHWCCIPQTFGLWERLSQWGIVTRL
jgi:hypothetical protein